MVRRQFLTPPTLPEDTVSRCLVIPNSKEWLGIFNSVLLETAQAFNYEQVNDTDMSPDDVAAFCFSIYEQYLLGECGADMTCVDVLACMALQRTRYDPETGEMEVSTDGGETWESGRDIDPRFIGERFSPIEGSCDDANAITGMLFRYTDDQLDLLSGTTTIFAITGVVVAILATVLSGGAAMPLLIGAASVVLAAGGTALDAAMTEQQYEDFRCMVYCIIDGATEITPAHYDAMITELGNIATGLAYANIHAFLASMGPVGLQNAVSYGLSAPAIPETCEDCPCGVCADYSDDMETGLGPQTTAVQGAWTAALGRTSGGAFFSPSGLPQGTGIVEVDLTRECTLSFITVWGRKTSVQTGTFALYLNLYDGDHVEIEHLINIGQWGTLPADWHQGGTSTDYPGTRYIEIIGQTNDGNRTLMDDIIIQVL